jgi:hypothetical protein
MVSLHSGHCGVLHRRDGENLHGRPAKWVGWLSLAPEQSHQELSTLDRERTRFSVAHNRKQRLLAAGRNDRVQRDPIFEEIWLSHVAP